MYNKNTLEKFKSCDKQAFIEEQGAKLFEKIENGTAIVHPVEANDFFVLSFADLKKYNYYYWFAFPTLANIDVHVSKVEKLENEVDNETFLLAHETVNDQNKMFYCLKKSNLQTVCLNELIKIGDANNLSNFDQFYFVFADPSTVENTPGWPLRNYINLLLHHW